ncbi:MAG TPA: hypothetical protein VGJ26_11550, partial [Pirellulales bacterium]
CAIVDNTDPKAERPGWQVEWHPIDFLFSWLLGTELDPEEAEEPAEQTEEAKAGVRLADEVLDEARGKTKSND